MGQLELTPQKSTNKLLHKEKSGSMREEIKGNREDTLSIGYESDDGENAYVLVLKK